MIAGVLQAPREQAWHSDVLDHGSPDVAGSRESKRPAGVRNDCRELDGQHHHANIANNPILSIAEVCGIFADGFVEGEFFVSLCDFEGLHRVALEVLEKGGIVVFLAHLYLL